MEKCTGVAPATGDPPTRPAAGNVGNTTDPATLESKPGENTVAPANTINQTDLPTTNAVVVPRDDTPPRDRGRALRITGIAVAGVGGVSGVVAVLFALKARREADLVAGQPAGTRWDDALVDHERDGQDAQTRARVFTIIGAAAVVTGGALWWYGRGRSRVSVDIALGVHAREVSVSCAF